MAEQSQVVAVVVMNSGMKRKDIQFDEADLVRSVEAFSGDVSGKQKLTLRTRPLRVPKPAKPVRPAEIRAIRRRLNASQTVFAALLNVAPVTAASWECGRRKPTGPALRLLDLAWRRPDVLLAA